MKRKRYSEESIVTAVKLHERDTSVPDICRKPGIAKATFYRWHEQYGGLELSQARELRQLREENTKLKRLAAGLSLDKIMLQAGEVIGSGFALRSASAPSGCSS